MGKNHFPPVKPKPKPNPNPNPVPAGVPLIWWTENADGRLKPDDQGKTAAEKANVGIATLIIQRDDGTLWRVKEDKAPYTWTQIAVGAGGGKDPYTTVFPQDGDVSKPFELKPWMRVVDDGKQRTYQIPDLEPGDSFEIVDFLQTFDKKPVTLTLSDDSFDHFGFLLGKSIIGPDGALHSVDPEAKSITLDVVGEGSVWRFAVVNDDIVAVVVPTFSEG